LNTPNPPSRYAIVKKFSTLDWQFTKPWESICEHIIAQRVTRGAPFYLTIIREPNETLFCTSKVGDYSKLVIGTRCTIQYSSFLLFLHGSLGWHLVVRYQGDATSHSNRVSCEFAAYRLYIKASGYSMLQDTARLVLREVSTVASEMRVPRVVAHQQMSSMIIFIVVQYWFPNRV